MIGLALSGGGSRAIAFHLGCLRALNSKGILDRVNVLSAISGGSIIGAYYAYTPEKSFDEFESDIHILLKEGFQKKILFELIKPKNLFPVLSSFVISKTSEFYSRLLNKQPLFQRFPSRTDVFHKVLKRDVFPGLLMDSQRRNNMSVVIGSCELSTGSAFRFGNERSGYWRGGELVDNTIDVSFAAAASAAYPIMLPAFDRTWEFTKNGNKNINRVILTDGGVYDNLGIQVLEPGRDPKYSIHTFPCEYLIVCSAGQGLSSGKEVPMGFYSRVKKSFDVIHQRVQVASAHRLHYLKRSELIKGFILPYLGQQDDALPYIPDDFVRCEEVNEYPTNFEAMDDEWIINDVIPKNVPG